MRWTVAVAAAAAAFRMNCGALVAAKLEDASALVVPSAAVAASAAGVVAVAVVEAEGDKTLAQEVERPIVGGEEVH